MRPCEPELAVVLRQRELRFETRIDSWLGTVLLASRIPFADGAKITEDATAQVGGSLDFEVPADRIWNPDQHRDTHPLGDMGQRLHVTRYVVTGDQRRHPVVMGWWTITESPVEDGEVKVKASELWQIASDFEFPAPMVPDPDSRWTALRDVLSGTIPQPVDIPAGLTDADELDLIYDEDRVTAAYELIDALGGLATIDPCGMLQVVADPPEDVVAEFRDGVGGTVAEKVPTIGPGAANAYIVRTEPDGEEPPIQAIATLSTGPMRWDGPYGNRPEFYTSPLLKTYAQCLATANRMLARSQSRQLVVKVTCAPDPRLQINDRVSLDWTPDSQSLTRSLLQLQTIDHPLTPDTMTFTAIEVD